MLSTESTALNSLAESPEKKEKIPFFLFPALACNARLYGPQKEGLGDLCRVILPDWLEPLRGETLPEFARRWGEVIWKTYYGPEAKETQRLDPEIGCFTGGVSFGGMVSPFASDVLREHGLKVHKNFRISTFLYGNQIPKSLRFWWNLSSLIPFGGWNVIKSSCWLELKLREKRLSFRRREILKQFLESPCIRCQRVVKMIANWRGEVQPHDFPTVQIHGLRDRLLPISLVESPEVLRLDASHLMTLTRPDEVNELLRKLLS
ncbi:MAG: hypothetical protein IJQ31_03975 [Thermoguttaceae bacterium]|nr:hypothetical protein [Thermoguttaceae bacterium]